MVFPDCQPMRVSEEPVCINLFRQNRVFTSLHLRSPVHVVPPRDISLNLKVGGNEKKGGSGRSKMLDNGLGPWRSRFIFNLNLQFLS